MKTKINLAKLSSIAVLSSLVAIMSGCGTSLRMAKTQSIDAMKDPAFRTEAARTSAGYQESNGVPSVATRFASRPKLKVAVLQYAATIQGDVSRDFKDLTDFSAMAATYGGKYATYELKKLDAIEVPGQVGLHVATDGLKQLEAQLRQAGFEVIDSDKVVNTTAYKKYYGNYPQVATVEKGNYDITSLAAGWSTYAPFNHHVKPPTGMITIAQHHWLWPETVAIKEIADELNEDVLFVTVSTVFSDHKIVGHGQKRSRVGEFNFVGRATVVDPEYVGYGIGGFGHTVAQIDANTTPAARPDFLKEIESGGHGTFVVDWNMLVTDSQNTNDYFAKAFTNALKELKNTVK